MTFLYPATATHSPGWSVSVSIFVIIFHLAPSDAFCVLRFGKFFFSPYPAIGGATSDWFDIGSQLRRALFSVWNLLPPRSFWWYSYRDTSDWRILTSKTTAESFLDLRISAPVVILSNRDQLLISYNIWAPRVVITVHNHQPECVFRVVTAAYT